MKNDTLQHPAPLDPRIFHSKAVVEEYQQAVADYLAQQAALEYRHGKTSRRKQRHNPDDNY